MAETKAAKTGDLGQKEVQREFSAGDEQGYFGRRADPFPLSAHSLESGPDSPTIAETEAKRAAQAEAAL